MTVAETIDSFVADRGGCRPASDHAEPTTTAVDKALLLLNQFRRGETVGVSELARRAGLTKSTAFRLLSILHRNGFVDRRGSGYHLGSGLYDLGGRVLADNPGRLRDIALPYIADLYECTHEMVHFAVLDDTSVLYLEKLHGHQRAPSPSRVGGRVPAFATAIGKVLLAHDFDAAERAIVKDLRRLAPGTITDAQRLRNEFARVHLTGAAYDNEESSAGLVCVAVPVQDRTGRTVAGLSISGAKGRFNPESYAHKLRATAFELSNALRRAG